MLVFQEFWPIEKEKKHLNKLWIMYKFNRNKKNPFEQKLANFKIFRGQKLTSWFSSWPQKLTLWARENISIIILAFPSFHNFHQSNI
jgi:hypothetical protein